MRNLIYAITRGIVSPFRKIKYTGLTGKFWLIMILFGLITAGCKKVVEETGTIGICPVVVSTDPAAGAINVPTNKIITATFNEPMDPASINTETFVLKQGTTQIFGTVTYSGLVATFTPSGPLTANTVYTALITNRVKDPAKNAMIADYTWTFNTGAVPTVVATNPVNGATDVGFNKIITATFSTNMDPLTINSTTFVVRQGVTPVAGTVSYAGMIATFTPSNPLIPNAAYTATITTGAKDVGGNALAANYNWSFATGAPPQVLSTDPANGATNVMLNKVVNVVFSKNMDASTINATNFTIKQGTTTVAGTVSYSGKTASFTPAGLYAVNTVYTGTVTTGAKDSSGNALPANYTWSFTTGNAPVVVSTDPANGDINVALNKVVTASFSTAMSAPTINNTTFTLRQGSTNVAGVVTYANSKASFTPAAPLAVNTVYTGTITTGARDSAGVAMAANYTWSFTTASAPTVISTDPANGEINVALNKLITASFSTAMNPATIDGNSFTLKQGTTTVNGVVGYAGTMASFKPNLPLSPNTVYTGTITTAAKDLAGNPLQSNYTWTFTTTGNPPTVISTDPAPNATGVILSKIVTATFSKAMDPATINVLTFTLQQGVTPVVGTVTYSGTTASFNPTADLAANTEYTATITTGARDQTGNALAANYVWKFTTTAAPLPPPPSFLGTAAMFGAFGGNAGITNEGINTVINGGSIGTTAASTLITGFHDGTTGDVYTETPLNKGLVTGRIYTSPPPPGTAASGAIAAQGLADANLAYLVISPASKPGGTDPGAGELGNLTLAPGVYRAAGGTFKISMGDLTLDAKGDPNAEWIFQTAAGLTVGVAGPSGAKSVKLINGALAKNVYWYVGSAATINGAGGGVMVGTIISSAGVTFSTSGNNVQTVLNGRALSLVASVTMTNTTINIPK